MKRIVILSLLTLCVAHATNYQQSYLSYHTSNYTLKKQNNLQHFNRVHKAAIKGDSRAQYRLALMFHYGEGVRQNVELARLWFTRAAKRGHHQAQDVLYRFYSAKKPQYLRGEASRYTMQFRQFR